METLRSLIRLCEYCIHERDTFEEDKRLRRTHAEVAVFIDHKGRIHTPWRTHNHVTWLRLHTQLWEIMTKSAERLSQDVKVDEEHFRAIDLCFVLGCYILQCCHQRSTDVMVRSYHAYMPPPLIADADLLLERRESTQPVEINRFSMSMLMDHLYHLQSNWNELVYSDELKNYLLLLEVRASFFLACAQSELDNDTPAFHKELDKRREGELDADALIRERYGCSMGAVSLLRALFGGFYERLYWGSNLNKANDGYASLPFPYNMCYGEGNPSTGEERRARALRESRFSAVVRWIMKELRPEGEAIPSGFLKRVFPEESLWPGEKTVYEITNKSDSANANSVQALSIIRKFRSSDVTGIQVNPLLLLKRGSDYSAIVKKSETPTDDVIRKQLPDVSPESPSGKESSLLRLALHEHVSHRINKLFNSRLPWDKYVVMLVHLPHRFAAMKQPPVTQAQIDAVIASGENPHAELSDYPSFPFMAQLCNHWSVVYRGHVFWINSYIESFCLWLQIMESDFKNRFGMLDMSPLPAQIFANGEAERKLEQRLSSVSLFSSFVMN